MAIALAAAVLFVHNRGNMDCSDSMWSIPTAVSLLDRGSPALDAYEPLLAARKHVFLRQVNGHYFTIFPIGASIVAAPAIAALRPLARAATTLWPGLMRELERQLHNNGCAPAAGEPVIWVHSLTERFVASSIVALTTALIFEMACGWLAVGPAAAVAVVFAFGTSAWSTASRALWQHGPAMLTVTAGLLLLLRAPGRPSRLFGAGALLAFGYVCRPTLAISVAVLTMWVAWQERRRFHWYLAGCATVLTAFFVLNRVWYGMWLPPYYWPNRLGGTPYLREALVGDLISPSRGLFVFSPVLLLAGAGLWRRWRSGRIGSLDLSLAAVIVLHWITIASFPHWWGGYSFGPRFFSDVLPFFMYFLVAALEPGADQSRLGRTATHVAFVVTAAMSIFIHSQGALNPKTMQWSVVPKSIDLDHSRLWDWSHPQFLAGW